ncbi:methylmalonyl-CoA mutase family protein [Longibacter sp.]|uniref:methylmalonyl-CoA mutase family protein n=1 Tax=Longibacter sp. TaxID=2045415 RepID=UPI003EB9F107
MSQPLDDRSDIGKAPDLSFNDDFPTVSTEAWKKKIEADLRGKPLEHLNWASVDGVTLRPFYREEDLEAFDHIAGMADGLCLASERPAHVTASHASAGNAWAIRQDIADSRPEEAARRAERAVAGGAEEIGLQLYSPPLPDHRSSGTNGIRIASADDIATVLAPLDAACTAIHLCGGPLAAVVVPDLLSCARTQGTDEEIKGSVGFDPIGSLATGHMADPTLAFRLAVDTIEASADASGLRTLMVDARPYHDAGASAVQELAYTIAALSESLDQVTERGVELAEAIRRLHVAVPVDTSYFIEIGKLRALRLLATKVVNTFAKASGNASTVDPSDLHLQAHTSRRTQTVYGAHVNMLRGTTEGAAAVIGGCDVLTIAPFDEAFSQPSDFSARLSRNTQLILRHESHLDQVADPAAGSYYIEAVTDALINEAWPLFQSIEDNGGLLTAMAAGTVAADIKEVRNERRARLNRRGHVLVGTTHYPDTAEDRLSDVNTRGPGIPDGISPAPDADQSDTDGTPIPAVSAASVLSPLREAWTDGGRLRDIVASLAAPPAGGDPHVAALPSVRLSRPFERLRLRVEAYTDRTGRRPTALLAPVGPARYRSARATFAQNFLGVAGLRIVSPLSFDDADAAATAAVDEGADVVVACSSDETYAEFVPDLRAALDAADSRALLVVAGTRDDLDPAVRSNADTFVHRRAPLLDTLESVVQDLGIDPSA